MLGMLAIMAMTMTAGADAGTCARHVEDAAVARMIAAFEAEMYAEAEIYAEAESDFDFVLADAGLAGSTLGREQVRAGSTASLPAAFADAAISR